MPFLTLAGLASEGDPLAVSIRPWPIVPFAVAVRALSGPAILLRFATTTPTPTNRSTDAPADTRPR